MDSDNLAVIIYEDESTAEKVFNTLKEMQDEYLIKLSDIAYVTKDASGKVHVHEGDNEAAAGAIGGGFWGLLLGLIFFVPFLGLAVGAATGAIAGAMSHYGIDDKFLTELREKMKDSSSAIFVIFHDAKPDKVLPRLSEYGGTVLRTSLSKDAEKQLQDSISKGAPHM